MSALWIRLQNGGVQKLVHMISVCDAGENHPMMCVQSEPSMLSIVKIHIIYIYIEIDKKLN